MQGFQPKAVYQFGEFQLQVDERLLLKRGQPVALTPKAFDILVLLVSNNGHLVDKATLMAEVWQNRIVEENTINRSISILRKALEESPQSRYIETIPKHGYRFVAGVSEIPTYDNILVIEKHTAAEILTEEEISEAENVAATSLPLTGAMQRGFLHQLRRRGLVVLAATGLLIIAVAALLLTKTSRLPASRQPIKSIAVLPLKSLDAEAVNQALSLGFADALITSLGKLPDIKTLSTGATCRYTDETREPLEIGRQLGVDGVIDGTLQRANGKLRVTLRLFRVDDGKQIWSSSFDEAESQVFHLQDLMARQTAQALALTLKPKDREKNPTENLEAYNLYLQGQYLFRRRETSKGGGFFKKALDLDPQFARAWAGLAAVYAMGDAMSEAEATVEKALELDPDLAEAHAVRGFIQMFLNWNWVEAERSLNRAVELDPRSVEAHHWRGIYLSIRGQFDEAKLELAQAMELDPTSANMISDLGQAYFFSHQYEKAEEFYLKASSLDGYFSRQRLVALFERQGRDTEAFEAGVALVCNAYQGEKKLSCLEEFNETFKRAGTKGIAIKQLNLSLNLMKHPELTENKPAAYWYTVALSYLRLGEKEKAIDSLNQSLETKTRFEIANFTLPFIGVDPQFDELRDEARFQEILRKVRLVN
jgi:DNA-binding winged helix-turn-helix (wHTH) protein/TolB-like protein/Tfp pilus assembly protein PilF